MMMNVRLRCDRRSGEDVAVFASRWAQEVNIDVLYEVPLPCGRR